MSISFFPNDNETYCDANGLVNRIVEPCDCDPADRPTCHFCGGSGTYTYEQYPFEMNLSNGNALALLEALGAQSPESCGSVGPSVVLGGIAFIRALRAAGCNPLETSTVRIRNFLDCGRTTEQITSYLDRMEAIANEADRRKVEIVWG
jgi:hypothetical protein